MKNPQILRESYRIRSVVRAAQILELLRTSDGKASLNELSKRSELPKPSVFRLLRTLEDVGLVDRADGSDVYKLGIRCLELGHAYLNQATFRSEARPVLEKLRSAFNETVHLGVLDDELRVVYIEKLETQHAVGLMMSRVGKTSPSYCTGIGKALLANLQSDPVNVLQERGMLRRYTPTTKCSPQELRDELATIRACGSSFDLEEHEPGVRCVASPIKDDQGLVAAISIAGPAHRLPYGLLQGKLADATLAGANEISRKIGGRA